MNPYKYHSRPHELNHRREYLLKHPDELYLAFIKSGTGFDNFRLKVLKLTYSMIIDDVLAGSIHDQHSFSKTCKINPIEAVADTMLEAAKTNHMLLVVYVALTNKAIPGFKFPPGGPNNDKFNPTDALAYAVFTGERNSNIEELIANKSHYASLNCSLLYATLTDKRLKAAEPEILADRHFSGDYAIGVIKARWPELEAIIPTRKLYLPLYDKYLDHFGLEVKDDKVIRKSSHL